MQKQNTKGATQFSVRSAKALFSYCTGHRSALLDAPAYGREKRHATRSKVFREWNWKGPDGSARCRDYFGRVYRRNDCSGDYLALSSKPKYCVTYKFGRRNTGHAVKGGYKAVIVAAHRSKSTNGVMQYLTN